MNNRVNFKNRISEIQKYPERGLGTQEKDKMKIKHYSLQ